MREMTLRQVLAEFPTASIVNGEIIVFDGVHKVIGRLIEDAEPQARDAPKRGRRKVTPDAE